MTAEIHDIRMTLITKRVLSSLHRGFCYDQACSGAWFLNDRLGCGEESVRKACKAALEQFWDQTGGRPLREVRPGVFHIVHTAPNGTKYTIAERLDQIERERGRGGRKND